MGTGSGSQPKTTTTNTAPTNVKRATNDIIRAGGTLYNNDVGYNPYPGQTVADFSGATNSGLAAIQGAAQQGNPMLGQIMGAGSDLVANGGLTDAQYGTQGLLGQIADGTNGINTQGQYDALTQWMSNPTFSQSNLQDYANGSFINGGSPEFQKALDYQMQKVQDAGLRSLSANGRYGSAAGMGGLGDALAGQRFGAMASELARQQGLMMQANGQIDSSRNAQFSNLLSSIGGATNVQGQNIANQANAANSIFNNAQTGNTNTLNWAQMQPTLNEARYYDANQMLGAGQMQDAKAQQYIDANVEKFNQAQQAPWQRLGQYSNLVNKGVGNYGTMSTTQPGQPSTAQQVVGGLTAGAGILGKLQ
jgi:hypothetical protein